MKMKPCEFGSAHRGDINMQLEALELELGYIEGGTPDNNLSISSEVKLYGGLTKNGRPAELVRVMKNGKAFSIATGQPIDLDDDSTEGTRFKRSLSEEAEEDEAILRSMARRKRSASAAELAPKRCREPGCDKEFKRPSDLTKHEKIHSRPWKCPVESCKYHEYGWPTEKEMDRHHNDKHSASAIGIPQYRKRIAQHQREQSNGDERFLRR
jgi:hypothetical protein